MAGGINIQYKGADELASLLRDVAAVMPRALERGFQRVGLLIERGAKQRSPVDTGRLRSSIFTRSDSTRTVVSTNVNYAIYVHEGNRYVAGRPFLRDAAEQVTSGDGVGRIFVEEIEKEIARRLPVIG